MPLRTESMTQYLPGIVVLALWGLCASWIHFRGRERLAPTRQLFDHSTLLAPVNCLVYAFSSVPQRPYLDVDRFPALATLRAHWREIRDEALALDREGAVRASDRLDDIGFNSFFRTGWKRYYLTWYGTEVESARRSCPRTLELLRQVPGLRAAMFASLPPGARLVRHRDPYAGSLRYHLALTAPGDPRCALHVDGEPYVWRDGQDVVFDETFLHYAENRTDQPRIVLFCDVERPLRLAPARWFDHLFSRAVLGAAVTKNAPGDRVGLLNRVFGPLYQVRRLGKALKGRSRPAYYTVKYALFGGLLLALLF